MTKQFDPTKPVRTRDGREARIICTDYKGDNGKSIIALTTHLDGSENDTHYFSDGLVYAMEEHRADLVNIPEETVRWIVRGGIFSDSVYAQEFKLRPQPRADGAYCVKITYLDGKPVKAELDL